MRATTAKTVDDPAIDPIGALADLSASTPRAEVRLAAALGPSAEPGNISRKTWAAWTCLIGLGRLSNAIR
ncbi:hypothetical protein KRM28CT15_20250 [Krasilnikovia sp. M28-CT-15]